MSVWLYLRKSEKNEERQVQSLDDQERECREEARKWGLTIVGVVREEGSAWKPHKRPKFKKMLKELSYISPKRRQADGILAWHPNRLSRNAYEAGVIIQMLDDELIKNLFFVAYRFHNDPSGKLSLGIEFAQAKGSSDTGSVAVSRGMGSRFEAGSMAVKKKYGYLHKREHKDTNRSSLFPIPDPEKFPVVKRFFELALRGVSGNEIYRKAKQEFPDTHIINSAQIGAILNDSFYHGKWVICKGKKNERIVDLNKLSAPDGTRFTPAVNAFDFETIQSFRNKRYAPEKRTKRVNPLPNLVTCKTCGTRMYAAYRKIKLAEGKIEERLGYECHGKVAGERCSQGRVKSETIFSAIENDLNQLSSQIPKKFYKMYIAGLEALIKEQRVQLRSRKATLQSSIQKLKQERTKLIEHRASLIHSNEYDESSKSHFESQIEELGLEIQSQEKEKLELSIDGDSRILSFVQFLELRENLALYWKFADNEQKANISRTVYLNLDIEGKNLATLTKKPAFFVGRKQVENGIGGPKQISLEPYLRALWEAFCKQNQRADITDLRKFYTSVSTDVEGKFEICKHIP